MNDLLGTLRSVLHGAATAEGWLTLVACLQAALERGQGPVALDYTCGLLEARADRWRLQARWVPGAWWSLPAASAETSIAPMTTPGAEGGSSADDVAAARALRQTVAGRVLAALDLSSVPSHWIPPGTFTMGSPPDAPGTVGQRQMTLTRGLLVARTPITQGAWARVAEVCGGRPRPSSFGDARFPVEVQRAAARHPVEMVSWYEAVAFCNDLSHLGGLPPSFTTPEGAVYGHGHALDEVPPRFEGLHRGGWRLPTEAEWEYACRAGTTQATYAPLDDVAWVAGNSGGQTHAVGLKRPNAWGLHDTLGNVWEWCLDYAPGRAGEPLVNPVGRIGSWAPPAARGGSWRDGGFYVRAGFRYTVDPGLSHNNVGLRPVRTLCPKRVRV